MATMDQSQGNSESKLGGSGAAKAAVLACLPNAMFRLQTEDGRELLAHVAGDLRMKVTRLLPGDVVLVECSPFDRTKARICGLVPER
jgi:translation initiation factor IF-1